MHFRKMPGSLRQVLQKNAFLFAAEYSPPEAVGKNCYQSAMGNFDGNRRLQQCHEIHFIVNLGQKYEDDLGH